MSKRELQHMDPANVLESGSIRISRSGSAGQHHDPHGGENCKGSVQPPLSPVISLASDLELSPPPDWVFQECTPQGGGSFCETPVDEGRFRVWRGETFRALPHKRDVSSDESFEEADGTLTKLDIDLRQEIDRYVNDLNKDLDWPSNIDTEHRRIMARIGQCNKKALDAHDIELVKDMEAARALITSARDQWHIRTKGEVYTPVQRDRVTIAHDQGAIMDSYVPSVSTHPTPKQHNAPQQVRFKDRDQEENYHLSRMLPFLLTSTTPVTPTPVFVDRELTAEEQVNQSIELSANDDNNTWILTGEFCLEIPSFSDKVPTDNSVSAALLEYDKKMQKCIAGISRSLKASAQVHDDYGKRLDQLERKVFPKELTSQILDNGKRLLRLENLYEGVVQNRLDELEKKVGTLQNDVNRGFNAHGERLDESSTEMNKVKLQLTAHDDKFIEHNYAIRETQKVVSKIGKVTDSSDDPALIPPQDPAQVSETVGVPENLRDQIALALEYVKGKSQDPLPTEHRQSRVMVMEEVPKLDDQIANLVEYKKQLEDQSTVVNQRLIDEIVSTVRIGNDWAMQVERKDLELSPSHLHDHEDVELAVLYENGKQPVDVFFANFETYYGHASEKLQLLFLKKRLVILRCFVTKFTYFIYKKRISDHG